MSDIPRYSILFVLNDEQAVISKVLPGTLANIVRAGHDVHVMCPLDINEEFEISLRKIPWIHVQKLPFGNRFRASQFSIPFEIRQYIKRHDGINIIHSFGLNCGVLAYIGSIGLSATNVNTPDPIPAENKAKGLKLLSKFIADNISYVYNRLCAVILFISEDEKNKVLNSINYRTTISESLNITENLNELGSHLIQVYERAMARRENNKKI